jgi:hypothetical protein
MKFRSLTMLVITGAGCASLDSGPPIPRTQPQVVHERLQGDVPFLLVCAYDAKECPGSHPAGCITLEEFDRRPADDTRSAEVVFTCG